MRPENHPTRLRRLALPRYLHCLIGGALLGCGSSSKQSSCDPITEAENAIKSVPTAQDLKKSSPSLSALAQLSAQLSAVGTNGKNLESAVAAKCG